ncbi:hypothetical protein M885DRAFT_568851 [Pelagophyceae sp. CCMP2097]|nr:hypothetical protein M885DRAFT_568851 [Pelagophyceae sp. CCMP2097]
MLRRALARCRSSAPHPPPGTLPGGQRSTVNNMGFEMSEPSPLLDAWVSSFDGKRFLADVGCAYGLNARNAAKMLQLRGKGEKKKQIIICADVDPRHLAFVDALDNFRLRTEKIKLPDDTRGLEKTIGLSGVLCGEVFHFLSGAEIERSLNAFFKLIVAGTGTLCITASSRRMQWTRAGFEIKIARYGWHPGYPAEYRDPSADGVGVENIQIVAVKPERWVTG